MILTPLHLINIWLCFQCSVRNITFLISPRLNIIFFVYLDPERNIRVWISPAKNIIFNICYKNINKYYFFKDFRQEIYIIWFKISMKNISNISCKKYNFLISPTVNIIFLISPGVWIYFKERMSEYISRNGWVNIFETPDCKYASRNLVVNIQRNGNVDIFYGTGFWIFKEWCC